MSRASSNDELISSQLSKYLGSTRLSMDQVAKKWNVSCAMLSQIKNNKKGVGPELGLRILRESGASADDRKAWLEKRFFSEGNEFSILKETIEREEREVELQESFCSLIETNMILLDVFLDISLSEGKGVSRNAILKSYGEHGVELTNCLIESGVIYKRENRYFVFAEDARFVTNKTSTTIGISKNILENQKLKAMSGTFHGEAAIEVTDITVEGYEKLVKLHNEYCEKAVKVLEENEQPRLQGGIRVAFQTMVSVLKASALGVTLIALASGGDTFAGGFGGRGSGTGGDDTTTIIRGVELPIPSSKIHRVKIGSHRVMTIKRDRAELGLTEYPFKKDFIKTELFENKDDARDAAIDLQIEVATNFNRKKAIDAFENRNRECFKGSPTIFYDNKYSYRFRGFTIDESFTPDGTLGYKATVTLDFLCGKKLK